MRNAVLFLTNRNRMPNLYHVWANVASCETARGKINHREHRVHRGRHKSLLKREKAFQFFSVNSVTSVVKKCFLVKDQR